MEQYGFYDSKTFGSRIDIALSKFQAAYGLTVTGKLDDATLKLVSTPRCGNKDRSSKENAIQAKWDHNDLTYYYNNFGNDLSESEVRRLTDMAFKFWSDVTPLTFTEKQKGDIVLHFGGSSHHDGKKQCSYPFDGEGSVLAHAFFPPDGRLHYDDDEKYTSQSSQGINYLWVAVHELGHILGLEHDTNNKNAVMYPYYRAYDPNGMTLHANDIKRIQAIYGSGGSATASPRTTIKRPSTASPRTTIKRRSTTTSKGVCKDIITNCDELTKYCYSQDSWWKDIMYRECTKTCGFCTDPNEKCVDVSKNCHHLKQSCTLNNDIKLFTMKECRLTCGYCGNKTTTKPKTCKDLAINCDSVKSHCNDKDFTTSSSMTTNCRKTCNFC